MRYTMTGSVVLALQLVLAGRAAAQTPSRVPVDVARLGPQVGERIPEFSLPDQNGRTWTRESIMGPKGAMLVFYRSADW
jgi:hypothetical protein